MDEQINMNKEFEQTDNKKPIDMKKIMRRATDMPLPDVRSLIGRDIKTLRGLVMASNNGQIFASREDVANLTGISKEIVGGTLMFFGKKEIEFLESKTEKKVRKYKPKKQVIDFKHELEFESEEKAGICLRPLFSETWFGKQVKNIFKIENKPLRKDELFKKLGKFAGADPEYHRPALNKIIDYLEFSKIIKKVDDSDEYLLEEFEISDFDKREEGTSKLQEETIPETPTKLPESERVSLPLAGKEVEPPKNPPILGGELELIKTGVIIGTLETMYTHKITIKKEELESILKELLGLSARYVSLKTSIEMVLEFLNEEEKGGLKEERITEIYLSKSKLLMPALKRDLKIPEEIKENNKTTKNESQ